MATNKTEFLGLNQWVKEDSVLMEDFNADNKKIDDYLSNPSFVMGVYHGMDVKNSTQTIELGFQPSAVIIFGAGNLSTDTSAILTPDYPVTSGTYTLGMVTENGFKVINRNTSDTPSSPRLNWKIDYVYIACR